MFLIKCIQTLWTVLEKNYKGRYKENKSQQIRDLAKQSIEKDSHALAFELVQVIESIEFFQNQILSLDAKLKLLVEELDTPFLTIPGIGYRLAAIILSEFGDISRFSSPDKLLAFAGVKPSTYQSGQFSATKTHMAKHGSAYLRWALMQAARLAARRCPVLHAFLAQGKHYFVALGHVTKKLVRLIFYLLTKNKPFLSQTI